MIQVNEFGKEERIGSKIVSSKVKSSFIFVMSGFTSFCFAVTSVKIPQRTRVTKM